MLKKTFYAATHFCEGFMYLYHYGLSVRLFDKETISYSTLQILKQIRTYMTVFYLYIYLFREQFSYVGILLNDGATTNQYQPSC